MNLTLSQSNVGLEFTSSYDCVISLYGGGYIYTPISGSIKGSVVPFNLLAHKSELLFAHVYS
jgi:hypothetical protein